MLFIITPFQPSMVKCLLKGTNKGVRSLLEESLTITREMLREAQLAYPRNPVRDHNHLIKMLWLLSTSLFHLFQGYVTLIILSHKNCHDQCCEQIFWLITSVYMQAFFQRVAVIDICPLCLQVLQSLKSKTLDLARALQSYVHCHISVSFNNTASYKLRPMVIMKRGFCTFEFLRVVVFFLFFF